MAARKVVGNSVSSMVVSFTLVKLDLSRSVWNAASLPVKLVLALLFNLKRMRNIKETIKRRLA